MVARKSSRVKKTTVAYQAPEPVHRTPRNAQPKTVPSRRSFNRDIELYMECVEDELSPAQLKAIKDAQKEHEKANDLIKEVRAGNTLVPSSQPNTFTIVPPKPSPAPPKPTLVSKVQTPAVTSVQLDTGSQRGLPPPRPAQFLSKHLQQMKKTSGPRVSPDVILISDTTVAPTTPKMTMVNVPVAHISGNQLQMQPMTSVIASPSSGAVSQQVYKFVTLPSSVPVNNQYTLRPMLTLPSQKQPQLAFLTASNQQGIRNVTPIVTPSQHTDQIPAPKLTASTKQGKTDNQTTPGQKRSSPMETSASQPPAKKKMQNTKASEDGIDLKGNWVPLDEYYYGTHEGDTSYTEEKGEYRFKCWYCSKMLYNNVRAMQHIQGHIDASKQQNIDLSDLTQCKHCYKQFDTPFEMQTHVEKVHLSNKVLMCRICEKDFSSQVQLSVHMKSNHHACEMPYVCHLCNFRSSMYSDVVDHFKKKHDSSHYLLCLYCLRTFEVKFVSQGVGQTQTYYGHLLKHQTKSATKKCVVCRLTFFNTQDVKSHRKNCHVGNYKDVKATQGGKVDSYQKQRKGSTLKSLNAPSVSRIQDYGDIVFPAEASNTKCVECKMMMSSTDHYKKYVHCSMCRFATSCSVAYANHMMGFHSGQMSSLNLNIPWERPMKHVMYCACGFNSKYGNKIANHLVYCGKWTSYSTKRSQSEATAGGSGDSKKEGSILGMLGLVQKSSVTTIEDSDEIISKPKVDKKIKKDVEELVDDTNKKVGTKRRSGVKPVAQEPTDKSDKDVSEDVKAKDEDVKDETKQSNDENSEKSKDSSVDKEKGNTVKEVEIIDLDLELGSKENLKEEEESGHAESEKDTVITEDESKKDLDNVSEEVVVLSPKEGKQSEEEDEEMDQETVSDADVKTGNESDEKSDVKEKEIASETKETDEMDNTDGKLENKVTSDEKEMDTETDLKGDNPEEETLEKSEEMETTDEVDKDVEQDFVVESPKGVEEEKPFHETSEEATSIDIESKNAVENVAEEEEMPEEVKETDTEQDTVEGQSEGKEEKSEEKETELMQQDQESAQPTQSEDKSSEENDEMKPKEEEETPKEGNEPKEQEMEKESKVESCPQKELGDEAKREKSIEKPSSSDRMPSSERHSQERRRDSSERQSAERRESAERYHSGSRDRPRYDDRSRHEDRHHHDNRAHGSNRSDSHHDNRPNYRDRSYDRDRDYNRNRHGDNRSGHGYHDNRGYGGQGHRGQYGGYQGNRGDHYQDRNRGGNNQDRNYNRNYQNRGGYNQNYRGNYRGGYY